MPATLRGIYHNLSESTYCVSNGEIIMFFSSSLYQSKYLERYKIERERFKEKVNSSLEDEILNMETLSDINFYKRVEKRGFYIWLKGVEISWHEIHKYALRKMIGKNTPDWSEIQRPKLKERLKIME
jgi:hypothetical protein